LKKKIGGKKEKGKISETQGLGSRKKQIKKGCWCRLCPQKDHWDLLNIPHYLSIFSISPFSSET